MAYKRAARVVFAGGGAKRALEVARREAAGWIEARAAEDVAADAAPLKGADLVVALDSAAEAAVRRAAPCVRIRRLELETRGGDAAAALAREIRAKKGGL
jgi:hypothetical protein